MATLAKILAGISGLVATAASQSVFQNIISTGTVVVAMLLVIIFGYFAYKGRQMKTVQDTSDGWKDLYEQERAKNELLADQKEAERIAKHKAKDELAGMRAQLEVERMKPDLNRILDLMTDQHQGDLATMAGMVEDVQNMFTETSKAQAEIVGILQDVKDLWEVRDDRGAR